MVGVRVVMAVGCARKAEDVLATIDKALALGIEDNCARYGEPCVAGIEMGEPGGHVDDADRWVRESLDYLARVLPDVSR